MNKPENQNPQTSWEGDEFMEITSIPLATYKKDLDELAKDDRCVIDARVSMIAEGLELAKRASKYMS